MLPQTREVRGKAVRQVEDDAAHRGSTTWAPSLSYAGPGVAQVHLGASTGGPRRAIAGASRISTSAAVW